MCVGWQWFCQHALIITNKYVCVCVVEVVLGVSVCILECVFVISAELDLCDVMQISK